MSLGFTVVDLVTVVLIVVSAIYAVYRGFVAETLSIFAWLAATFAALYLGPWAAPLFRGIVSTPWLAMIAGCALVFLVTLIPISFASHRISAGVQSSAIGPIDRALGFAFGVARGLAIVAIAYLLFTWMVPIRSQPAMVRNARLLPLIQSSAEVLLALAPAHDRMAVRENNAGSPPPKEHPVEAAVKQPVKVHAVAQSGHKRAKKTYGAHDRRALDRLIEATGNGGNAKP